ncbi:MAG: GNAT family N-acetyltransferase [Promethearchaeota archaeon]
MGSIIQSYKLGDEEEIVSLYEAAFGEADYYFPRSISSWIWRYVQRPYFDPESILMIRKEEVVVAALSMTYGDLIVNGAPKKIALIDDVSTLPKWRRQGLATALIEHAIKQAREMGCWGVHLVADPTGSAIRIYRNLGFETITLCINMLGVLKHRRAARLGKRRQAAGLLALSLLDLYKNARVDKSLCAVEIAEGSNAAKVALRAQKEFNLLNGTLLFDGEYIKWMTSQRTDGALKVSSILVDQALSGMVTVSSSDFSGPGARDKMAVIGNLAFQEEMHTRDAISSALHGAKMIARNVLDCPIVSMFADERDETLKRACKKAGFIEVGNSASMFHPLGHSDRLAEIREGLWTQPVETSFSNP